MEYADEDTSIQNQIDVVNSNKTAYEVVMHDEGVSPLYVIQCFQDWFSSAVRLFYNVLGEKDPIFLSFKSADVTGNRFVLAHVYQSLQADYTILLEKVKKILTMSGKGSANKDNKYMDKLELLQTLLSEVKSLEFSEDFDDDYIIKKSKLYIKKCFGAASEYLQDLEQISFSPSMYYNGMSKSEYYKSFMYGKHCLSNLVSTMIEDMDLSFEEITPIEKSDNVLKTREKVVKSRNVFVVHGHEEHIRVEVEAFLRCIGYEPIVLFKEPNKGQTIIEKIEANANDVCYSIVLYTPCDIGRDKDVKEEKPRARQNVVFEHGYMCAKLGRAHVCALYTEGVELPGDMSGVIYTKYDDGGLWKYSIAKEMNAVGLQIDMNKIR